MKSYSNKFKSFQRKATQTSLRVFNGKLFKLEPCKSCKIPYKPSKVCGLSSQSIQTLYFGWYLKSYHFANFLLQILLLVVNSQIQLIFYLNILVCQTNGKQPYSFPVLSRFWNGLWRLIQIKDFALFIKYFSFYLQGETVYFIK